MRVGNRLGWWTWVAAWMLAGCGPNVTEMRTVSAPARAEDCSLEFIKANMNELSSGTGEWEMLGQIVLQEEGVQDPFAERYRAIVRPRACAMGGEAVAIVMSATSEGLTTSGSATSYGVLRKRTTEPAKPAAF
jgi:hypothetical protein